MIGESFGSYLVTAPLGRGAMGEVFEARHRVLGKRVAIKVLSPAHSENRDSVERFFNEARAASAVEHRGIVEILDVGRASNGRPYLVMEYLEGESLGQRLRKGRLDQSQAVRILRQVAGALDAAHARDIVHRDLKPDNIFLARDPDVPGGERAKILDFGIAKLLDPAWRNAIATQSGAMIGTPLYMAPEQCRGSAEVDRRADLYALGCVLFEMLAGRPPFQYGGLGELVAAHMFEPAPSLRMLDGSISEIIDTIVKRLLAKQPEDRFAGVGDLLTALSVESAPGESMADGFASTVAPADAAVVSLVRAEADRTGASTLRNAAGQRATESPTPVRAPALAPARVRIAIVSAACLALVGLVVWVAPGSATRQASVPASDGEREREPTLDRATGQLRIDSEPDGAQIWIAGELRGVTPRVIDGLDLENVTSVELRLRDAPPVIKRLDWADDSTVDVFVTFGIVSASVLVESTPPADLFRSGSNIRTCRTPCNVTIEWTDGGPTARREFILRESGFVDLLVTIEPGRIDPVRTTLEPVATAVPARKRRRGPSTAEPARRSVDPKAIDPKDTMDPFGRNKADRDTELPVSD